VAGTDFALAYYPVPPTLLGQAVGGMVAGVLSIVVALVVTCFGLAGARAGWGPIVAGAFAVLAAAVGLAGIGLGVFSVRRIGRAGGRFTGRRIAFTGIICGAVGLLVTVASLVASLLI
jgi:hypothetical protein